MLKSLGPGFCSLQLNLDLPAILGKHGGSYRQTASEKVQSRRYGTRMGTQISSFTTVLGPRNWIIMEVFFFFFFFGLVPCFRRTHPAVNHVCWGIFTAVAARGERCFYFLGSLSRISCFALKPSPELSSQDSLPFFRFSVLFSYPHSKDIFLTPVHSLNWIFYSLL